MLERQPTRSKRVREERRFDRTQLRAGGHGRVVNRDYAAHFFRWGWVARQIQQGESILDVGCGQDLPLLYVLGNRIQTVPDIYVGCDLNQIAKKPQVRWADILDNYDFVTNGSKLEQKYTPFDKAICFEVIEHMSPEDGERLLVNLNFMLRPNGLLYLSTPVFDGMAAANHIHEYGIHELQDKLLDVGFIIERRIGTFASKPALTRVMTAAERELYNEMEEWYGGEVLAAATFAFKYPDASRNNLWVCRRPE